MSQNHYEVLQLSPQADQLVITKVYRLLAAYYHPDNTQTGNEEKFKGVLKAYEVLSDPAKRAKYNSELRHSPLDPVDGQGERSSVRGSSQVHGPSVSPSAVGRQTTSWSERELRGQLLLALYDVRRNNPTNPELSLLVISELLGCSIVGLEFSKWYLKEKGLIRVSESADFSITISGVDYVENELMKDQSDSPFLRLPEARA